MEQPGETFYINYPRLPRKLRGCNNKIMGVRRAPSGAVRIEIEIGMREVGVERYQAL